MGGYPLFSCSAKPRRVYASDDNRNPRQMSITPTYLNVGIASRKTTRADNITSTKIRAVKGKTKLNGVFERAISQRTVLKT